MLRSTLALLVLLLSLPQLLAQGGEGNGADALLRTQSGLASLVAIDRFYVPGDPLRIELSTSSLTLGVPLIAATLIDATAPQPSQDFGIESGILGVIPGGFSILLINGLAALFPIQMGVSGSFEFTVVAPAAAFNAGLEDLMLQGFIIEPTVAPQGIAVSNSVRLVTTPLTQIFVEDITTAQGTLGLDDSDLGFPFNLDTTTFTNDHEVTGLNGFATQTAFSVVPGGSNGANRGPDLVCKFTATAGGNYRFSTCGALFDSAIYIVASDGTPLIFNEDSDSPSCQGTAGVIDSLALLPGEVVYVVVDGFNLQSGTTPFEITLLP